MLLTLLVTSRRLTRGSTCTQANMFLVSSRTVTRRQLAICRLAVSFA